ncbi:hypothetical protein QUB44_09840 [Microcoleus sp. AT3-D2]|uniref:hypothetical protein n=1 Tax=Microcoleus sp. S13_B4 TaxID=3055408 RepID=UPI002FCE9152
MDLNSGKSSSGSTDLKIVERSLLSSLAQWNYTKHHAPGSNVSKYGTATVTTIPN